MPRPFLLLCMPGTPNVKEDLLNGLNIMRPWADRGFFVISIDRPYHGQREGNLEQNILEKGMVRVWGNHSMILWLPWIM